MRNQIKLGTSLFITSKPSKIKIIPGTMGTICLICNQNSSKPMIRKEKVWERRLSITQENPKS